MLQSAQKTQTFYGKKAAHEVAQAGFIPYTRHIDPSTLATKAGAYLKVIKLQGLPFETSESEVLAHYKQTRATLLRGLGAEFALYHHIIRRKIDNGSGHHFPGGVCAELDLIYQRALRKKELFINEHYLTLLYRPSFGQARGMAKHGRSLFPRQKTSSKHDGSQHGFAKLNEATEHHLAVMAPYGPKVLTIQHNLKGAYSEPLSFLHYLLSFEMTDVLPPAMSLDQYLSTKRLSFGRERFEVRGRTHEDFRVGALLSVKEYADHTQAGSLDFLLKLPHEFILTQSFAPVTRQSALSAINETMRKVYSADEGAESTLDELCVARDNLTSGKASFGSHHLTITAHAKNAHYLEQALNDLGSSFTNAGILSVREDLNMEAAFWATLPGNFAFIARKAVISNHNMAGFASFHNYPMGQRKGGHWGSAVTNLETSAGTPYWFSFHVRDVGNFTCIGPTGAGKTALLTFLLAQSQHLHPRAVYFDKDRGAEIFVRSLGGTYIVVTQGYATGLNPLQLSDTLANRAFLVKWLEQLITSDQGPSLTSNERDLLNDAVAANFEAPKHNRRLSYLADLLAGATHQGVSLDQRLQPWHSNGARAWLFDNAEDTLALNKRTIGFDMTAILDDPAARTPWLMYIFHRLGDLLDGEKLMILLDEGWKLLDDQIFAYQLKDWMKTVRKANGLVGFATQSPSDAINSSVGPTILEQSPTQIFLPNIQARQSDYCQGFGLSAREFALIKELTPESRCFLIKQGAYSVIAKLDLTGLGGYMSVLSGRREHLSIMESAMEEHGTDPDKWLSAFLGKAGA